ncbi:MAG TPA: hypothetical protein VFL12_01315, partial [Thermoanaerobaculia bacterium]|nr:hypothetical protein [Thermoanaerobaculia bacterium]
MRRFVWFFAVVACAAPADAGRGRWTTGGPRPDAYLVVVDPLRSDVVYASIGSGGSLYRSVDGGRSWTPIASPPADSIAVDPSDDALLYLGNFNIFFSRDFGVSWSEVAPDLTASDIQDIVVAPDDTDTLYVETHTLATGTNGKESYRFARVRRGTEGTWSWSVPDPAFTTAVTGLVADASSSGTIFASGTGGVYRSTDAG